MTVIAGLDWDPPLQERLGAHERLCGIGVFHDFPWTEVFPDERTQFKDGKDLARTVGSLARPAPAAMAAARAPADAGFETTYGIR